MYKYILFLFAFIGTVKAQVSSDSHARYPLTVGDMLPDLVLPGVINFSDTIIDLTTFNGKLVILDFWSIWCGSCIEYMPEMEALQNKFKDQIQIILVTNSTTEQVEKLFKTSSIARNIKLPSIIGDTTLTRMFEYRTVPTHVWIDENGKIIHFTDGATTTEENIRATLAGERLKIPIKKEYRDFSGLGNVSLLEEGGGRQLKHLKQYSFLMGRIDDNGGYSGATFDIETGKPIGIKITNADLRQLYLKAFTTADIGHDLKRIVLEITDSSQFICPSKNNLDIAEWRTKNLYSYESRLPVGKASASKPLMQRDLDVNFGYIVRLEKRLVRSLVLTCTDSTKLTITKGGYFRQGYTSNKGIVDLTMNNGGTKELVSFFRTAYTDFDLPVIDGTALSTKFDLNLQISLTDISLLNKELKKQGLLLVEKDHLIDMIVINDKKSTDLL